VSITTDVPGRRLVMARQASVPDPSGIRMSRTATPRGAAGRVAGGAQRTGAGHRPVAYHAGGLQPPMTTPTPGAVDAPTIRILIADDHEVVRIGLAALLDRQPGFSVVAEAASGSDALRLAMQHRPDVAVLDIRMPDGSGTDACRAITSRLPGTSVVMLTSYADSDALFDAIAAGASGYVLKRIGSDELVRAIRAVAAGDSLLDPSVTSQVLARLRELKQSEEGGAFNELTDQERRVLAHVAEGRSNREIGQALDIAEKTVRNYVSNILAKLGLESRAQAAAFAIRNRLAELSTDRG
jgi:two-component system response regulator DevR